jgi:microcystin-dependent protein
LLDVLLQVAVMHVLVPLLVEVARPGPGTPVTPLLRDMACKLVSAMPTSAAAAAFRTAVTALPAASKQRLQLALREQQAAAAAAAAPVVAVAGTAAAAAGAVQVVAAADAKKPAIQLKMNFAMPGASK